MTHQSEQNQLLRTGSFQVPVQEAPQEEALRRDAGFMQHGDVQAAPEQVVMHEERIADVSVVRQAGDAFYEPSYYDKRAELEQKQDELLASKWRGDDSVAMLAVKSQITELKEFHSGPVLEEDDIERLRSMTDPQEVCEYGAYCLSSSASKLLQITMDLEAACQNYDACHNPYTRKGRERIKMVRDIAVRARRDYEAFMEAKRSAGFPDDISDSQAFNAEAFKTAIDGGTWEALFSKAMNGGEYHFAVGIGEEVQRNAVGTGEQVQRNAVGVGERVQRNAVGVGEQVQRNAVGVGEQVQRNAVGTGEQIREDGVRTKEKRFPEFEYYSNRAELKEMEEHLLESKWMGRDSESMQDVKACISKISAFHDTPILTEAERDDLKVKAGTDAFAAKLVVIGALTSAYDKYLLLFNHLLMACWEYMGTHKPHTKKGRERLKEVDDIRQMAGKDRDAFREAVSSVQSQTMSEAFTKQIISVMLADGKWEDVFTTRSNYLSKEEVRKLASSGDEVFKNYSMEGADEQYERVDRTTDAYRAAVNLGLGDIFAKVTGRQDGYDVEKVPGLKLSELGRFGYPVRYSDTARRQMASLAVFDNLVGIANRGPEDMVAQYVPKQLPGGARYIEVSSVKATGGEYAFDVFFGMKDMRDGVGNFADLEHMEFIDRKLFDKIVSTDAAKMSELFDGIEFSRARELKLKERFDYIRTVLRRRYSEKGDALFELPQDSAGIFTSRKASQPEHARSIEGLLAAQDRKLEERIRAAELAGDAITEFVPEAQLDEQIDMDFEFVDEEDQVDMDFEFDEPEQAEEVVQQQSQQQPQQQPQQQQQQANRWEFANDPFSGSVMESFAVGDSMSWESEKDKTDIERPEQIVKSDEYAPVFVSSQEQVEHKEQIEAEDQIEIAQAAEEQVTLRMPGGAELHEKYQSKSPAMQFKGMSYYGQRAELTAKELDASKILEKLGDSDSIRFLKEALADVHTFHAEPVLTPEQLSRIPRVGAAKPDAATYKAVADMIKESSLKYEAILGKLFTNLDGYIGSHEPRGEKGRQWIEHLRSIRDMLNRDLHAFRDEVNTIAYNYGGEFSRLDDIMAGGSWQSIFTYSRSIRGAKIVPFTVGNGMSGSTSRYEYEGRTYYRKTDESNGYGDSMNGVASYRMAQILGSEDLFVPTYRMREFDATVDKTEIGGTQKKSRAKYGVIMEAAKGMTYKALSATPPLKKVFSPKIKEQMSRLAFVDFICGQMDRKPDNFCVEAVKKVDETTGKEYWYLESLQAIDSDQSIMYTSSVDAASLAKGIYFATSINKVQYVDRDFYNRIMRLNVDETKQLCAIMMGDCAIDQAMPGIIAERLEYLKRVLHDKYMAMGDKFFEMPALASEVIPRHKSLSGVYYNLSYAAMDDGVEEMRAKPMRDETVDFS